MGLARFFLCDAGAIIESATTMDRKRWNWADGSGVNWNVEVLYNRQSAEVGLKFRATGNTASSLGRQGETISLELTYAAQTVTAYTTVDRWVDFFVYYGIEVVFDVAPLGNIDDIARIEIRLV